MTKVTCHKDDMLEEFMSNSTPEELKAYIRTADELLNERNRVIEAIPACNVHGHQCVPHALEWIEQQRERVPTPAKKLTDWIRQTALTMKQRKELHTIIKQIENDAWCAGSDFQQSVDRDSANLQAPMSCGTRYR